MKIFNISSRISGLKERYLRSSFLRDALTLMTGTTLAQIVPIAVSPLLTRMYSPGEFGLFSVYFSLVSVLFAVSTGRYEYAIMLPKEDDDAANVLGVTVLLTFLFSCCSFLVFCLGNDFITDSLGNRDISTWLYLVSPMVLLMGYYQGLTYWSNRRHHYKRLAISDITLKTSSELSKVVLGIAPGAGNGLIVGTFAGQIAAGGVLSWQIYREDGTKLNALSFERMWAAFKKYWRFPVYSAPYSLIGSFSNEFIILALSAFSYFEVVGFLGLTRRFIMGPISFLSSSLGRVFFREAAGSFGEARLESLTLKLMFNIADLATPVFVFFTFWAPELFSFFFGKGWYEAGRYAAVLMPVSFLFLFTSWPERIYEVAQKQNLSFLIQAIYDIFRISLVWGLLQMGVSPLTCIICYSVASCAYHGTYLWGVFHVAHFKKIGLVKIGTKVLVRVLVVGGILSLLKLSPLPVFVQFVTGGVITGMTYLLWYFYLARRVSGGSG